MNECIISDSDTFTVLEANINKNDLKKTTKSVRYKGNYCIMQQVACIQEGESSLDITYISDSIKLPI